MTHVYAEDPFHRDVLAARLALNEGLNALRESFDGMIVNAIRGESPKQTGSRRTPNGPPAVAQPHGGNGKFGGRVGSPRPPAQCLRPVLQAELQWPVSAPEMRFPYQPFLHQWLLSFAVRPLAGALPLVRQLPRSCYQLARP